MPETGARYHQLDRSAYLVRLARAIHDDYCEKVRG
jgi:hypothetical protein